MLDASGWHPYIRISAHPWKLAEAEARLLEYVKRRAISAIDQCEIVAQEPFTLPQLTFDDADHVGQSFFAACDRVLRLD